MDYKVEQKPTLWEVTLSCGCYSDRDETHIFFSANDENEVWNFLCRYIEDVNKKESGVHYCGTGFWDGIKVCGLKWGDNKFRTPRCNRKKEHETFDSDYGGGVDVEIKRLNVIYFAK